MKDSELEPIDDPADDWNTDPDWTLPSRVDAIDFLLTGDRTDRPTPNIEEDQ